MYVKKDFLCVARTLPGMPEVRWVALPHCCAAHVPPHAVLCQPAAAVLLTYRMQSVP